MVPPCAVERPNAHTTPDASHHLPPSSQPRRGESAPAASAATWGGRTATPRQTIDSEGPTSQVGREQATISIRKVGAVVDRGGELPWDAGVGSGRLEDGDQAVGRVAGGVEAEAARRA